MKSPCTFRSDNTCYNATKNPDCITFPCPKRCKYYSNKKKIQLGARIAEIKASIKELKTLLKSIS